MSSSIYKLTSQGKIIPPSWLASNIHLEAIMGSHAYGCNSPGKSDLDINGFYTPPKACLFPNTAGLIVGFDDLPESSNVKFQHIFDDRGREYDIDLFNVTKFFKLCSANCANQIDLLFVSESLIKHITAAGRLVLDRRHIFLSKLVWKQFRNYASGQFKSLRDKTRKESKRAELIEKHGYDVKFASHCIRLLREAEQILTEGNLDLFGGAEEMKAIRRGEWVYPHLEETFNARTVAIEKIYHESKLPETPDPIKVKQLLLDFLEHHYGSLAKVVTIPGAEAQALRDIDAILTRVRSFL